MVHIQLQSIRKWLGVGSFNVKVHCMKGKRFSVWEKHFKFDRCFQSMEKIAAESKPSIHPILSLLSSWKFSFKNFSNTNMNAHKTCQKKYLKKTTDLVREDQKDLSPSLPSEWRTNWLVLLLHVEVIQRVTLLMFLSSISSPGRGPNPSFHAARSNIPEGLRRASVGAETYWLSFNWIPAGSGPVWGSDPGEEETGWLLSAPLDRVRLVPNWLRRGSSLGCVGREMFF